MTGPGFQDVIPETNWMFPAGKTEKPLNPAFGKLVKPAKTLMFSPEEVAAEPQGLGRRMAGGDEQELSQSRVCPDGLRKQASARSRRSGAHLPPAAHRRWRRSPSSSAARSLGLVVEGARDVSGALAAFDSYLFRVVRFTLWQAALSTVLSVVPAIFVARALSRHPQLSRAAPDPAAVRPAAGAAGDRRGARHPGAARPRRLLRRLLSAAVGQTAGRASTACPASWSRMSSSTCRWRRGCFWRRSTRVPADQWRLASQLGMGARSSFRLIEWPALRASLPGVAGLVFMLCITSFTIVLTLGGGPARDHAGGGDLPGAALRLRSGAGGGADAAADRADHGRACSR